MADSMTAPTDMPVPPASPDVQADPNPMEVQPGKVTPAEIVTYFRAQIESSKSQIKRLHGEWKRNVDLRMGRLGTIWTQGMTINDMDQTEINPDWSLTKTKTANLYSQVPVVQVTHENKQYAAAIPPFAKALNYELGDKRANVGVAMEECLNDVVNAAGIAAAIVGYAARFEPKQVPLINTQTLHPEVLQQMIVTKTLPMTEVQAVADYKFYVTRISPTDILTPAGFKGSCFDQGPWVGYRDGMSRAMAKTELKLTDEQLSRCTGGPETPSDNDLRTNDERSLQNMQLHEVRYIRIFYWRYLVDTDEKSFTAIWTMVFVEGLSEPVMHEPWKGQRFDEQANKYVGSYKFPLRILTLTYITDNPIPPSDSAAGRPQVNDLRRSRSQMFKNRERSTPLRWFDVNRVDPAIQDNLLRGTVQGMIPTNGDGSRTVGEIARASYPAEDFAFDRSTKADLMETWQIGANQQGVQTQGSHTKAEVDITQANFATRMGQERGRVASFFLGISEVLSGLMALYSDFPSLTSEEKQALMQAWDIKHISPDVVLKIRPDSQIVLDSQQRSDRLMQFLNMTAKSGYVNIQPIIVELAELAGLDPSEVIIQPQPPKPQEPNISLRFTGKDDLANPMVVAMLLGSGQAPTSQEIEQAKQLLVEAQQPPTPPQPQQGMLPGMGQPPMPPAPGEPVQSGIPPGVNEQMALMSPVAKRSRDIGGA